jgi:hypothetical protein
MRESIQDLGLNIFVVIYMKDERWEVDTDEDGTLSRYDDLQTALDRVNKIRESGCDACLSVIIE